MWYHQALKSREELRRRGRTPSSAQNIMMKEEYDQDLVNELLSWLHFVLFLIFSMQAFLARFVNEAPEEYQVPLFNGDTSVKTTWGLPRCIYVNQLVSAYFCIVSAHHLALQVPFVFKTYLFFISKKVNYFRWSEYAFTSSLMVCIMAILCNLKDIVLLCILFSGMFTVIVCGLLAEIRRESIKYHFFGWILFSALQSFLFYLFATVAADAPERAIINILIPSMFILFSIFGVVQVLDVKQIGPWKSFTIVDITYMILSVLTKTTMGFLVIHICTLKSNGLQ